MTMKFWAHRDLVWRVQFGDVRGSIYVDESRQGVYYNPGTQLADLLDEDKDNKKKLILDELERQLGGRPTVFLKLPHRITQKDVQNCLRQYI